MRQIQHFSKCHATETVKSGESYVDSMRGKCGKCQTVALQPILLSLSRWQVRGTLWQVCGKCQTVALQPILLSLSRWQVLGTFGQCETAQTNAVCSWITALQRLHKHIARFDRWKNISQ